jgi:hypothetical protein
MKARCIGVLVVLGVLLAIAPQLLAEQGTLVRTSQMWGKEVTAGEVNGTVGIAGECFQVGEELNCTFLTLAFVKRGETCTVAATNGFERLRLVSRTREEVRWGGTTGPYGPSGVMTTTVLIAKRNDFANRPRDYFNDPAYGPGPTDFWSYEGTLLPSSPHGLLGSQSLAPTTTKATALSANVSDLCRPTNAMIVTRSPEAPR